MSNIFITREWSVVMARSAVQLYSLREVEESLPELIVRAGNAGYEGVEYATRVSDAEPEAVRSALAEAGVISVAAHVSIDVLEDDLEATVEFYRSLGCDRLVVPWLDPEHFESAAAVEAAADRLLALAERVADQGARLYYHNHVHEFVEVDGQPAFELFAEATDESLGLELDLGWAAAGADPVSLLDRWGERASLVHVSDADKEGSPTEVGDGVLDIADCATAVRDSEVEWAIYEHDEPTDPLESLAHGAEVLREF